MVGSCSITVSDCSTSCSVGDAVEQDDGAGDSGERACGGSPGIMAGGAVGSDLAVTSGLCFIVLGNPVKPPVANSPAMPSR